MSDPATSKKRSARSDDKPKKDKKWWEVKREKKKAKRSPAKNISSSKELKSNSGGSGGENSRGDSHVVSESAQAIPAAEERGSPEEACSTEKKKKKKKSKNKAMSAHATYGTASSEPFAAANGDAASSAGDNSGAEAPTNTSNALEDYAESHSESEPPVLAELRAATKKAMPSASHMTSGPLQGRLLKSLVAIKGAMRVLEIGTFTGYSAQCMAEAINGGSIVTLEIDPEAAAIAKEYFAKGGHSCIELLIGPAMDSLQAMQRKSREPFDLVFMDADKKAYRQYYDYLLESGLLAPGALILCDNVLFKGMVLNSLPEGKARLLEGKKLNYWQRRHQDIADALHDFNAYVARDPRTAAVLVPLRDGLTIIRRL